MNADIVDLRDFYATRLGQAAARSLAMALTPLWRPIHQERLVGFGYTLPFLDRLTGEAERTLAFMPAWQGAVSWPHEGRSRTALVEADELPLGDASVDRVLMVHALEFAEDPGRMLREIWRVLAPGGRLVLVVPNRRGLWTRLDRTPFGSGRPWSRGQAVRLLREAMFTTSGFSEALLFPPFRRESFVNLAMPLESAGRRFWPLFAGVIVIEATKLVYRGLPVTRDERARIRIARPVLVPQGAALNRCGPASPDEPGRARVIIDQARLPSGAAAGHKRPPSSGGTTMHISTPTRRLILSGAACLAFVAALVPAALAQDAYPDSPITLVVPFPPGGTLDTAARLIAAELESSMGQPVLVDNRSGAGGNIGADFVAKSEPDGYTILMGALSTHGVNVSLYPDMPFDPVADFAPVTMVATTPNILVVGSDVEAETLAEFIELAKAEPEGFTFSSGSSGSAGHLAGELLKSAAGLDLTHVPYRGSAAALQAVLAGEVQFIFDNLASASSHIGAGTLRPLAVTTAERSAFAPDVPTMGEAGIEGFDISTWFGVLAPAGTPEPIIERLNTEIRAALESERLTEALAAQGTEATPSTPQEFADFIASEIKTYAAIIDEAGIRLE